MTGIFHDRAFIQTFFDALIVQKPITSMDLAPVRKWALFFIGILCAIVIADTLAMMLVSFTGIEGWMKFLINFILYAVFFFAILYTLEKLFRIEFFGFNKE
ncbi:MAG: hypothetical protein MZV70_13985 [Desulfobacterales bacterium]|nr:hypothetical protein [Desulfobacterales bacterium]